MDGESGRVGTGEIPNIKEVSRGRRLNFRDCLQGVLQRPRTGALRSGLALLRWLFSFAPAGAISYFVETTHSCRYGLLSGALLRSGGTPVGNGY